MPINTRGTVLLSGGAGYIGGHVALALREHGWQIVVLDDLSTGNRAGVLSDSVFIEGNIGDRELLDSLFTAHQFTAVLHLAAVASVPESVAAPVRCDKINRQYSEVLINAAREHRTPYFIFSSTSVVYDENGTPPFAEEAALRPTSPYAASKLAAEQLLHATAHPHYAILRYFNVGGADPKLRAGNHKKKDTTLIKSALECVSGKRPHLLLYGTDEPTADGTCVRDYIHVSDIAAAHVLALEYLINGGKSDIFNIGLGRGFSVREVITAVRQITGNNFKVIESARREGDPATIIGNAQKAARILGFAPRHGDLHKIITDAWAWERHHSQ